MEILPGYEVLARVVESDPGVNPLGSNIETRVGIVAAQPTVEPKNHREKFVDLVLGRRVRVQFSEDGFITRVRARCIISARPPRTREG